MLLIACVNYKTDAATIEFARSVLEMPNATGVHLAIADNSSSLPLAGWFGEQIDAGRITLKRTPDNPGYLGGAYRAIHAAMERGIAPDVVVISNTDITFPQQDLLVRLRDASLRADSECAGLAPRIISEQTAMDQNPFFTRRPGKLYHWTRARIFASATLTRAHQWLHGIRSKRSQSIRIHLPATVARPIYAPHGSFLVFFKPFFSQGLKVFEPLSFLFCEEFLLAERARKAGLSFVYEPSLVVRHNEHQSTGADMTAFKRAHLSEAHRAMHSLRRTSPR